MTTEPTGAPAVAPPDAGHAPRTYESAWQWNDDGTAKLMTAEDWLAEEASVDAALREGDEPDPDGLDRAGTMRAIAAEVATLRAERTQWAQAYTALRSEYDAQARALAAAQEDTARLAAALHVVLSGSVVPNGGGGWTCAALPGRLWYPSLESAIAAVTLDQRPLAELIDAARRAGADDGRAQG